MKKSVLLYVFDGFADWEASFAMVGIAKSTAFQIRTLSIDKNPKLSMGGIKVNPDLDFLPDTDLKDIDATNTAMLILPGGSAWEEKTQFEIAPLVEHCYKSEIPVAAICGATIFLADLGLLNGKLHTSNDRSYLEMFSPLYRGQSGYLNRPSVRAEGLITAGGVSSIEFARDIFEELGILEEERVKIWFSYFQNNALTFMQYTPGMVAG